MKQKTADKRFCPEPPIPVSDVNEVHASNQVATGILVDLLATVISGSPQA
jgi:hypothetical protein